MIKKNIIVDTDIGGDCDDAGALVLLKTFCQQKKIRLNAVTSCTTMEGAENTIASVLGYYGINVPVGVMQGTPFMCTEAFNRYAKQIKERFPCFPDTTESVALLRKTLAETEGETTIVAIGPQRNLARLLSSEADGFSPLDGISLVSEKVEELVIMGGSFLPDEKVICFEEKDICVEWNIEQDISAARLVNEFWPTSIVYSPFELGYCLETGRYLPKDSPARLCYDIRSGLTRASWDICAAYYGAVGCGKLFSLSPWGKVSFDVSGKSKFFPAKDGKRRILLQKSSDAEIERTLDELMR